MGDGTDTPLHPSPAAHPVPQGRCQCRQSLSTCRSWPGRAARRDGCGRCTACWTLRRRAQRWTCPPSTLSPGSGWRCAGRRGQWPGTLRPVPAMLCTGGPGDASPNPAAHPIPRSTEAAGLRSRAEQLATRNAKLQRDAEVAEELNTRLAEETAQLKAQLRRCGTGAGLGASLSAPGRRGRRRVPGWVFTPRDGDGWGCRSTRVWLCPIAPSRHWSKPEVLPRSWRMRRPWWRSCRSRTVSCVGRRTSW